MVFLYGFYYAQELAVLTIIIVFASFVPIISITGFIFFSMRHLIDSYNLLTVNRKEIDSSTQMFQKILLIAQFAIVFMQLCFLSYFWLNSYLACASLMTLVLCISLIVIIFTFSPLLHYDDESINNEMQELQVVRERAMSNIVFNSGVMALQ
jgi:hypothetical protein